MATEPRRPPPLFLLAAARSGAQTLRNMLMRHPGMIIAPEFDFLVDAISPDGRFMKREAFLRSIEYSNPFKRLGLNIPQGLPFVGIANNLLEQVAAAKPGAPIVGFTAQRHFDRLLWLWPDARFIHLVRDGRDVAFAQVMAGRAGNMWHGIENWVDAEMLWDRMSHKLPPDRQFTLKYESLVGEPQYELHRICQFIGLPYDPEMLGAGPPPREDLGRWRKTETAELQAAEHRAARWLLQNSYFLSGTVRPPSILRRAALNIQNRLAVTNHKRELLGTKLWLKGGWTARFGGKKAKARLKRQQGELLAKWED